MDLSELERLIEIVRNANIGELTLRQGTSRITIRKPPSDAAASRALTTYSAPAEAEAELYEAVEVAETLDGALPAEQTVTVTAPSVGVFHHVKPIVGLQARVAAGQVIGVVEAMDLLTDVTAANAGTVTDILVEDGMPVEYGQGLFVIQTED